MELRHFITEFIWPLPSSIIRSPSRHHNIALSHDTHTKKKIIDACKTECLYNTARLNFTGFSPNPGGLRGSGSDKNTCAIRGAIKPLGEFTRGDVLIVSWQATLLATAAAAAAAAAANRCRGGESAAVICNVLSSNCGPNCPPAAPLFLRFRLLGRVSRAGPAARARPTRCQRDTFS
ncbi:hypothetical protein EVAR_53262_1 [Eumeta japonica]|uniref:Uncharacterized protein n=1 Tax=Eumeta variegata TaxID=151549 RepID=A0A4C1YK66_EUMVA|nr:hypothetical protein EVAR_53262_1 [Eumeta japonica]